MAVIGSDIQEAIKLLRAGDLVAIPTETVYGLAGNALRPEAVARIFETKERPTFDPLIVHVANLEQAYRYVESFPVKALELAKHFWPGPITLLLPRRSLIPDLVTSGLDTVGIRCPDHPLTQQLLSVLDFPLAAPSANPFGYISPTTPDHVNQQLGTKIPYILDGGPCRVGLESTIVGFEGDQPVIHRMGGLSIEKIVETVGMVKTYLHSSSNPVAPGQLKSHYAPRKKIVVGDIKELLSANSSTRTGVISFQRDYSHPYQIILTKDGNLNEASYRLFSALRDMDQQDVDLIVTELVPDHGLGKAINDRLTRAAAQRD